MELIQLAPLAIIIGVLGIVVLAFTQCAVAELIVRVSAFLYEGNPAKRVVQREEWLRYVRDMQPRERPVHAGSILWMGVRHLPGRYRTRSREKAFFTWTATDLLLHLNREGYALTKVKITLPDVVAPLRYKWRRWRDPRLPTLDELARNVMASDPVDGQRRSCRRWWCRRRRRMSATRSVLAVSHKMSSMPMRSRFVLD